MDLNPLVDKYREAIRARDPQAVAALYAPEVEMVVHGLGGPESPWNSKRQTGSAPIAREYERFFALTAEFTVDYTDRIIDQAQRAVAMIVRIAGRDHQGNSFDMANALHFYYDPQGLIARMINWYGQAA